MDGGGATAMEMSAGGGADEHAISVRKQVVVGSKIENFISLCRKNKKPARGWFLKT